MALTCPVRTPCTYSARCITSLHGRVNSHACQHWRAAFLALALGGTAVNSAAVAGEFADFNAAVEKAEAHNRVAIGYLRTGNIDLASLEVDRLRDFLGEVQRTLRRQAAGDFDGNNYYIIAMTDIATRLITADLMLHTGHPDVTRQALLAIRNDLYKLRGPPASRCWPIAFTTPITPWTRSWVRRPRARLEERGDGFRHRRQDRGLDHVLGRCDAMADKRYARIPNSAG